jgi:hypothetical protein
MMLGGQALARGGKADSHGRASWLCSGQPWPRLALAQPAVGSSGPAMQQASPVTMDDGLTTQ